LLGQEISQDSGLKEGSRTLASKPVAKKNGYLEYWLLNS